MPGRPRHPILEIGCAGRLEARLQADEIHTAKRIGQPVDVAQFALLLAGPDCPFLSGSCLTLDSAISGLLHDPTGPGLSA